MSLIAERTSPRSIALFSCCLIGASVLVGEVLNVPDAVLSDASMRASVMPDLPASEVGAVLQGYYHEGLGGLEAWEGVKSLRLSGQLKHRAGQFKYQAFLKKPNLCKQEISNDTVQCAKGYNGDGAWRKQSHGLPTSELSSEDAAVYQLDAQMGSQLLYPYAEGKTIELVGTAPLKGRICHQVRVSLSSLPVEVSYFIDVHDFLEWKRVYRDMDGAQLLVIEYGDYQRFQGVPVALREVQHCSQDKWVSTLRIDQVRMNAGVMPWMFAMPE